MAFSTPTILKQNPFHSLNCNISQVPFTLFSTHRLASRLGCVCSDWHQQFGLQRGMRSIALADSTDVCGKEMFCKLTPPYFQKHTHPPLGHPRDPSCLHPCLSVECDILVSFSGFWGKRLSRSFPMDWTMIDLFPY